MPVFASLTGSSQKGGGYDVGSAQAVTTDPALHSLWSVPWVTSLSGSGPAQLKETFYKLTSPRPSPSPKPNKFHVHQCQAQIEI